MSQAWFKDSAEFIKGLDAQDVDDRDGVLDSQSDDGDGVLDLQTKEVIKEASMLPTMSSNSPKTGNTAVSEYFVEFDALKKEVLLIKKRKDDEFDELTKRFSNMDWKKLDNDSLLRESIIFKCSSQVVVGRLIFWAGHERFVSDDGHIVFKKHLLVSFDLIGHSFQAIDIDVVFRDGLTVLMCFSIIRNSLILSGSMDETDCYLFCGWSVLVDVTSLTSFTLLFAIPTPNYVKLLGFTMKEISLPIVKVPGPHQLANSVQVYNISTQTLQNLNIQGVAGSFFIR
nr:hypothetical protein [Tanacetum cinerariifolium]